MGKALASPKSLPALLMTPVLILIACIILSAPRSESGGFFFLESSIVDFNIFLPHSTVDALFVIGNILIFIFAAIGFRRFWSSLHRSGEEQQLTFFSSLWLTVKEILSHVNFRECEANQPRRIGHMLLLYGFIGAMITTGAIFIFIFVPHYLSLLGLDSLHSYFELPVNLPHPVKILGALSGLALVIGSGMLVYRRWTNSDEVGANGYVDYLFIYILFFTGLTGMLSWLTRLFGIPMLAYVNYFLHLVCVFFLLWYMPYSKFAHMIYRTLALVHARSIGRMKV
jgi:quinone-modifying oxidoreductase subunit QmoC